MKNEIFVVDSFIKDDVSFKLVDNLVNYLNDQGKDICLVSHLPLPECISRKVNYTIYDSNNIIGPISIELFFYTNNLHIRWNPLNSYHGASVYTSLYNSLKVLDGLYEWVHFVEYDINPINVPIYLNKIEEYKKDSDVIGMPFIDNPEGIISSLVTNMFSIRPELVNKFPIVRNWDDYKEFNTSDLVFENWIFKAYNNAGARKTFIESFDVGNIRSEGDQFVIRTRCEDDTGYSTIIYFINLSQELMHIHIGLDEHTLYCNQIFNYIPCSEKDIFTVGSRVYKVSELKINGNFQYKDASKVCPDWDSRR